MPPAFFRVARGAVACIVAVMSLLRAPSLLRISSLLRVPFVLLAACLALPCAVRAATLPVATPAAFAEAVSKARPGDALVLAAGDWRDARLRVSCQGTAEALIVISAEQPGRVRFTGRSNLVVDGAHVVVRGFVWTEGRSEKDAIVALRGVGHRVTDCAFIRYNPDSIKTRYPWVHLTGQLHRVDHCRFEGQTHSGVTLQIRVGQGDNRHRVDRNHFLDRRRGDGNGFETIQVGLSQDSLNPSRTVVEENLFVSCDGEIEVISNKSCENTYRRNTFRACAAALTLRHGDRCLVERNAFFAAGKKGAAGIRVIGSDHIVRGNYLEGVGDGPGGVIAISAGIPDSPLAGYWKADRALVQENLLWHTTGAAFGLAAGLGTSGRTLLAKDVRIEGNAIVPDPARPAIALVKDAPGEGFVFRANAYRAPATQPTGNPAAGFSAEAPLPEREAFLARCQPLSPADVGPSWWPQEKR